MKKNYAFIRLLTALVLLCVPLAAQDIMPPAQVSNSAAPAVLSPLDYENVSVSIRWVANEYLSPETEKIDRNFLTFESFDEAAGEDVRVEIWGLPQTEINLYVLVHDRLAEKWWAYGAATHEGSGTWVVHGVRFGEGVHQGQRYTLRAAILPAPLAEKIVSAEEWQNSAVAISDPVYATVRRRLIQPYQQQIKVNESRIWLQTIDHLTASPTEPMVVPANASVAGTMALPTDESGKPLEENFLVYVLVRATTASQWRRFGPAEVNGVKWEVRNVELGDPGEPQWAKFQLTAIISTKRLDDQSLMHQDWWPYRLAAGDPVEVSVKPHLPTLDLPLPEIRMNLVRTMIDTQSVFSDRPFISDSLEEVLQVSGQVDRLPQGASIWVLINPVGTRFWEVHGKAIVTPPQWRLPLIHSHRFRALNIHRFRVMAIVSTSAFQPGLVDYDHWRQRTLALSEPLIVEEKEKPHRSRDNLELEILSVAREDVDGGEVSSRISALSRVQGTVDFVPQGTRIWVGTRGYGTDMWRFSGPALVYDREWNVPDVFFDIESPITGNFDVVAIASQGDLPVETLRGEEIQWYSTAASQVVSVRPREASLIPGFQFADFAGSPGLFAFLLILLLLFALEYYFEAISRVAAVLAAQFEELGAYLHKQFADMPRPQVIPSALSIIILVLGVYGIVSYFPIYTHALEEVLALSPQKSRSLALLLIIFIGLAGVITHLSVEYTSNRQGNLLNKIFDYFLNYALPITILLVTFALWGVQALLYLELYIAQVEPGNIRIPAAMGAAAFFIAGIETLGFYWATRLGKEIFGWLIFHVFIIGPAVVLARGFLVINAFFTALPSRMRQIEEPAPHPASADSENL